MSGGAIAAVEMGYPEVVAQVLATALASVRRAPLHYTPGTPHVTLCYEIICSSVSLATLLKHELTHFRNISNPLFSETNVMGVAAAVVRESTYSQWDLLLSATC